MRYVKTRKVPLVDATYAPEIIFKPRNRDFYTSYPVPKTFTVPVDDTINENAFQTLALWYARGCSLVIKDVTLTNEHPREAWEYWFVNSLPQYYIKKNATTIDKAYKLGQDLIEACYKASNIPFHVLEEIYKVLLNTFMRLGIKAYSPNLKTYLEVNAENQVQKDLDSLFYYSETAEELYRKSARSEEELYFYARVFDIEMPEWFICQSNIKTKHGFAVCPYIDSKPTYNLKTNDYAGNLNENGDYDNVVPFTLKKDAIPYRAINEQAELIKLNELVDYYLNLPIEDQLEFLSDNYGYCSKCREYYSQQDGCSCGHCLSKEEEELKQIAEACKEYARTH